MRLSSDARTRPRLAPGFRDARSSKAPALSSSAFSSAGMMDGLSQVFAQGFNGTGSPQLDSWIAIGRDGIVTAYTGKCDFGQGLYTAQMQLVAEEVGVPLNRVRLVQCDTSMTPDQGTTSGSSRIRPTSITRISRSPVRRPAKRSSAWRPQGSAHLLPISSRAMARRGEGQSLTKRGVRRSDRWPAIQSAARSSGQAEAPAEWTVLGTAVPRVDMRDMVTGRFEFVHNVRVPGMLHGRVVRPPEVGATVGSVDESSIRELPGIVKVVVKGNFIGVVAQKPWQAMQGCRAPQGDLDTRHAAVAARRLYSSLRKQPARDTLLVDSGDVDAKLTAASTVLKATYRHPYQMHASMGSSCAVADVAGRQGDNLVGDAVCFPDAQYVGDAARPQAGERPRHLRSRRRLLRDQRRGYGELRRRAALAGGRSPGARAAVAQGRNGVGELRQRVRHRSARRARWQRHHQRVGLRSVVGRARRPAWLQHAWQRRHRVPRRLEPAPFAPRTPAPAPNMPLDNGSNTAPSYIAGRVRDSANGAGVIRSERVLSHRVLSPFFTGPLRAPERLQNTFAHECFMDEVAAHVKADPVEYRLKHLNHARLSAAIRAAAKAANWEQRPSPRRSAARTGRSPAEAWPASAMRATTASSRWSPTSPSSRTPAAFRSHDSSSRRTAGRSPIPTVCATRSKEAHFRV